MPESRRQAQPKTDSDVPYVVVDHCVTSTLRAAPMAARDAELLAAVVTALEMTTYRPIVWSNKQYVVTQ